MSDKLRAFARELALYRERRGLTTARGRPWRCPIGDCGALRCLGQANGRSPSEVP